MPSERSDLIFSRHALRSQNVKPQASSGVNVVGTSGSGLTGNGCVGDSHSPGKPPCGTGRSTIGNNGLPLVRSKTNTKPCLVFCTTAGIFWSATLQLGEQRRRGDVVIPDVVVHRLEMPDGLASRGIERDQRARVEVVALAHAAEEVGRGRAHGRVDDAARLVGHHGGPDVGGAGRKRAAFEPRRKSRIGRIAGNRVEPPARRAGACIESKDRSGRRICRGCCPSRTSRQRPRPTPRRAPT